MTARDIIFDTEMAYKEMMRAWNTNVKKIMPGRRPFRYQRFRILLAVSQGIEFSQDIMHITGVDASTTWEILCSLKEDGHAVSEPTNSRSMAWRITKSGQEVIDKLKHIPAMIEAECIDALVSNTKVWYGRSRTNGSSKPSV